MPGPINPTRNNLGNASAAGGIISLILSAVFAVEGGYSNNPNDPGGETNHGVTVAVARANGYTGSMRDLPREKAMEIATSQYVDKPGYRAIVERNPLIGQKMIDAAYNVGPARESLWLQQSLNHLNNGGKDYPDIAEDGKIGAGTMWAFDALMKKRGVVGCRVLIRMLDAKQANHYMTLFGKNSKFETFAVGWFDNRIGNVDPAKCGK